MKNEEKQDKEYKAYIEKTIEEYNNNGKKTIVHICDTYYPIVDGVIKVMENYAVRQAEKYNIILIVPKHKNLTVKHDKYLVIGVASVYFKFVNYDLAFPNLDNYLTKIVKKIKIDLIHTHSAFSMGVFAGKLAKKRNVPMVMTMHSQYKQDFMHHTNNSELLTKALIKNVVKVYNKSTEVWTMHQKVANVLKEYGYKKDNFYFVPNATDYKIPENPEYLNEIINKKYNITEDVPVFTFVGRIVTQKNIFLIMDSLNILNKQGLDFRMFFVGNGPDDQKLTDKIKEYNLEDKVIQTGRIDDREELAGYYQRANLFLFPSTYDTSSLVQIEAATYKTAGVFIENTATAGTIIDRHNGFLCKETAEDFASTIKEAISNPEKLKEIAENAHNELYVSWDDVAKRTMERYEYLIKNHNKQG
ncbi:MAG: glycosyltransferase [Clostridia bacterium]|nr:glycosyltransferase [Clostridia bacterium]